MHYIRNIAYVLVGVAVLVASVPPLMASRFAAPRSGGARVQTHPDHVAAIAALEAIGSEDGWGRIVVRDDDLPSGLNRTIQVWLYGLFPRTEYVIEVDGVSIGSVVTKNSGDAVLKLQTHGQGHDQVPGELPPAYELADAAVFDESLAVVLEGTFTILRQGGNETTYEERIVLEDVTGGAATGIAKVEVEDDGHEELVTHATGLEPASTYTIVVDGFTVAVVTADAEGQAWLKLEAPDDDNPLPPELQPVSEIVTVEWYDEAGDLLLAGTFTGEGEDEDEDEEIELEGAFVELTGDGFLLDTGDEVVAVVVTPDTELKGFASLAELVPGNVLEVEALLSDDDIVAFKVELEEAQEDD